MFVKNKSTNSVESQVRQQEVKSENVELSFEAMETISGGAAKVKWSAA